jgi:hypothetical protein
MKLYGWLACCMILPVTVGCGSGSNGAQGPNAAAAARAQVDQRIAGVWRLQSYVPDAQLSPAMLLGMQSERIVVRIENGRVRSASSTLTFDRAYRIAADPNRDKFKLFIRDDAGVEYESVCEFDEGGRVLFYTITPPWRGRGVLEREGPAMARPQ